jgi:CheY-like chemotaxis protein
MKQSATILIVEDDQALNDAYQMILGSGGYTVLSAADGEAALSTINKHGSDPDVILLDLRMPVLDGVGFLKAYEPQKHPNTSVVVFSNYDVHKDIDDAFALGADRYVLKARATPKDLLHLVESVIAEKSTV